MKKTIILFLTLTMSVASAIAQCATPTSAEATVTFKRKVPGMLDGDFTFTVNSDGDKVQFSSGNLQYQASTGKWRFAAHQYDYVGDASNGNVYENAVKCNNANIADDYSGWIDLFGWGTSGYSSMYPYMTGKNVSYYQCGTTSGEFPSNYDWGVYNFSEIGWRTLTVAELRWLLTPWPSASPTPGTNCRTSSTVNGTANARYTFATINTDGTPVNGIIIFPDVYSGGTPAGVTWRSINCTQNYDPAQSSRFSTCTRAGWEALEAAGCVFLPAAGNRNGTSVSLAGSCCYYWTCSASSYDYVYGIFCHAYNPIGAYSNQRYYGSSVRLVRNVVE